MRPFTIAGALAALSSTTMAQESTGSYPGIYTLQAKEGFTTTQVFAPFNFRDAMITPLASGGSNNETTTFGANWLNKFDSLETTFTLGPNTAEYTTFGRRATSDMKKFANRNVRNNATVNGTTYANATNIYKCAYTPAVKATLMTAECLETTLYANPNVTTTAYATTTYLRPATETVTMPGLDYQRLLTAWDGMAHLYIGTSENGQISTYIPVATSTDAEGKVVTSTQGAGVPMVMAVVKAVIVMAAGAAVMAV